MDNKLIETWQDYTKNALSAAKELEVINSQVIEKLTAKHMELANVAFETGTKYVSTLSEIKGYQELIAEQTKLATEFNEKLIEAARTTADILTESREAYQAWVEKSFKAVTAGGEFVLPTMLFAPKKPAKKAA